MEKTPIDYSKLSPELQEKIKAWEKKKPENQQLQVLSDIAMMVQELINVADDTKKESKDSLKALGAVLTDAREQLISLNKKEAPESPDYAKPVVEAVNKLRAALQDSIDKIDVKPQVNVKVPKIDAPVVNVDSPSVSVDLKGVEKIIKNDIPKAFKEAIKLIPATEIPEAPDRWDEVLEWLKSIDTASRLKPQPGSMKVTNPDGSLIGDQLQAKDRYAAGVITTQNVSTLWEGTGDSSVVLDVEGPYSVLAIQTVGTYTGALTVQGSVDGLNWVSYAGSQILNMNTGLYLATITSALRSTFQVDISGMKYVRVTALAAVTGSVRVTMAVSEADSPRGALGVITTVTGVTTVTTLTNITNWGNVVDNGAFVDGTTRLMPGGYILDEVAGTALTENDAAAARIDSKRAQVFTLEDATTRGRRTEVTAANALKVDGSAVTQPVSGTVTVGASTMPTTLINFITDIPTAGTRVQLGSNVVTNGVIVQAPSTNTGNIFVGGASVSSTVFGQELQPGQQTSIAIDNTNKIYVDTNVSGSDVAVLGS